MKLVSTTLSLLIAASILIAASPAFSLRGQDNNPTSDEPNYKRVNGFSGYLTLDDDPHDHVQRWLDPVEIATLSAMPMMKRGGTMGAFVELMGCKQNAQGVCNARVNYTIYRPDGSIFATRAVLQREDSYGRSKHLPPDVKAGRAWRVCTSHSGKTIPPASIK